MSDPPSPPHAIAVVAESGSQPKSRLIERFQFKGLGRGLRLCPRMVDTAAELLLIPRGANSRWVENGQILMPLGVVLNPNLKAIFIKRCHGIGDRVLEGHRRPSVIVKLAPTFGCDAARQNRIT